MSRFFRRTRAIAHKELLHMIRDARVVYLALGLPLIMLVLFGYGVSTDVEHVPLAVVDQDRTRASRELVESFVAGGEFVRAASPPSVDDAESLLRRGAVQGILVVPRDYQRDLARGDQPRAQLMLDGSDASSATLSLGAAVGISLSRLPGGRTPTARLAPAGPPVRTRFNPEMRSAYNMVPGVIALILSVVTSLLTALTVAREWERGSMEQLFATPVGRAEIVVGKLLPYAGLGMVQTLLIVTAGSVLFDVPIRGSLAMLFGCSALFLLAMLGIGLLASIVTRNQLVSVQFSLIVSMLPTMLLSGFLFPIENMPRWLQIASVAVPGRYYMTALRGVLLKGNGLAVLGGEVLALALFAGAVLALALVRFRRRLA